MKYRALDELAHANPHLVVEATFVPKRLEDLRERAVGIGERRLWSIGWRITEADGGNYVGQHAWLPVAGDVGGWVPTEDLDSPELPAAAE